MHDALVVLGVICLLVAALALTLRWLGTWLFPLDNRVDACACRMYHLDPDTFVSFTSRGIRHTHHRCTPIDDHDNEP